MSPLAPSSSSFCSTIATDAASVNKVLKHRRRYCKAPDCQRIVKSQGLCQRHGAKPRICKVDSCKKQAQGNFDGMCKSHFKLSKQAPKAATDEPPVESKPRLSSKRAAVESAYDRIIPDSLVWKTDIGSAVPLVEHLRAGYDDESLSFAWHRNDERVLRGLAPTAHFSAGLEEWEHELAWTELLLLSGESELAFRDFAHAWGRERDFHEVLCKAACSRRGKCKEHAAPTTPVSAFTLDQDFGPAPSVSDEEESDYPEEFLSADFWGENDESHVEGLALDLASFDSFDIEEDELAAFLIEGH